MVLQTQTPDERAVNLAILASQTEANAGGASWVSTIWNSTTYLEYVSNLMAWLLDSIESFKNLFNWSAPGKTWPLYMAVVGLWLLAVFVPGRFLLLALGLYQFFACFLPKGKGESAASIKFCNLLHAVPNDDDLDKIYHFERRDYAEALAQQRTLLVRQAKKNLVLAATWEGLVQIKVAAGLRGGAGGGGQEWASAFLMLQGRRLVWWAKESDVDDGKVRCPSLLPSPLCCGL